MSKESLGNGILNLLKYWLQGLWRNYLNDFPLSAQKLSHFTWVDAQEIELGHFTSSLSLIPPSGKVWIAPIIFEKDHSYWIPLWLPATLNHTMLFVDDDPCRLPWIPASQFESGLSRLFNESLHQFDEWLRYECYDEEGHFIWQEWQELYYFTINFLDDLSGGDWREELKQKGFSLLTKALIINEENLFSLHKHISDPLRCQINQKTIQPTLNQYSQIEEYEAQPLLEAGDLEAKADLICRTLKKTTLTAELEQALIHAMSLENGHILAIQSPAGQCHSFIQSLIALLMVQEALAKKTDLGIFLLTPNHTVNTLNQWLLLLEGATKTPFLNPEIKALQIEDESAEKALNALLMQQHRLNYPSKTHWFAHWFSQLFATKSSVQVQKIKDDLSAKIRQIKVARTKLHQKLVDLVARDMDFSIAYKYWQSYFSETAAHPAQDIFSGWSLLRLSVREALVWEKIDTLPINASLMIINEANRLLPQQVAPFLAVAQKGLFLGDEQDLPPCLAISAFQEEKDLQTAQFLDEELIEQLHYKGLLPSIGNAMTVALKNNYWQELTSFGTWQSTLTLANKKDISYEIIPISGQSEKIGNGLCNPEEAKGLIEWLTKEIHQLTSNMVIVTSFLAQKRILDNLLKQAAINIAVFVIDELPSHEWDRVIFSPVYSLNDSRPFIFDQGDYYFYSLIARTKKTFSIVGNRDLFNPKMHSPSGNLAKRMVY